MDGRAILRVGIGSGIGTTYIMGSTRILMHGSIWCFFGFLRVFLALPAALCGVTGVRKTMMDTSIITRAECRIAVHPP